MKKLMSIIFLCQRHDHLNSNSLFSIKRSFPSLKRVPYEVQGNRREETTSGSWSALPSEVMRGP